MRELPSHFLQLERRVDPHFEPDERLYRRFKPSQWDGDEVSLAAFDLPDVSCGRGKYSSAADILFSREGEFDSWGATSFEVQHVPEELIDKGVFVYRFAVKHVPTKHNYQHSEVRAFEGDKHVDKASMPDVGEHLHLRFREMIQRRSRVEIKPGEYRWKDA
jgi:hypothetical protein